MSDAGDDFLVAVKSSARETNEAAAQLADEREGLLAFPDRAAAEERAAELSERGETPVAIQAVAQNDDAVADAYLVAAPERRTRDPDGSVEGTLTFDTTAAQYGALGEALLCCYESDPPVLVHYAREDLDHLSTGERDRLRIDLDASPDPVEKRDAEGTKRWLPDCRAVARLGPHGPVLREYWCEVKTGDASFERDQREVMRWKAREAAVLKVRFDVSELPDSYDVSVSAVDPRDGSRNDSSLESDRPAGGGHRPARLDEFAER